MSKPNIRVGEIRSVSLDAGEWQVIRHALMVQRGAWRDRQSTADAELNEAGWNDCRETVQVLDGLLKKFQ